MVPFQQEFKLGVWCKKWYIWTSGSRTNKTESDS